MRFTGSKTLAFSLVALMVAGSGCSSLRYKKTEDLWAESDAKFKNAQYADAVPYYAAYLAFLSAQRAADADRMWQQYQTFAARARQMSNGPVNPTQYPQGGNPVMNNQLGNQPQQRGQ